jgi:hypothetical protein
VAAPRESWTKYGQHIERQRLAVREMPLARQFLTQVREENDNTPLQPERPLATEKSGASLPKEALAAKTLLARSRITFEELL